MIASSNFAFSRAIEATSIYLALQPTCYVNDTIICHYVCLQNSTHLLSADKQPFVEFYCTLHFPEKTAQLLPASNKR